MPWWNGPTVLESARRVQGLRTRPTTSRCVSRSRTFTASTTAASSPAASKPARIKVGDRLVFSPTNKISTVKTIERWNAPRARQRRGRGIHRHHAHRADLRRTRGRRRAGEHAALRADPLQGPRLLARQAAVQQGPEPTSSSSPPRRSSARSSRSEQVIDASTLETVRAPGERVLVGRHEVAELTLPHQEAGRLRHRTEIAATGRFVIVDGFDVSGGGMIVAGQLPAPHGRRRCTRATTSTGAAGKVTPAQRTLRNGHCGCVVWLTGLSGSGKIHHRHRTGTRALQPGQARLRARRRQHPPRPLLRPRLLAAGPRARTSAASARWPSSSPTPA